MSYNNDPDLRKFPHNNLQQKPGEATKEFSLVSTIFVQVTAESGMKCYSHGNSQCIVQAVHVLLWRLPKTKIQGAICVA